MRWPRFWQRGERSSPARGASPVFRKYSTRWDRIPRRGPDEDSADAPGVPQARFPHRGVVPDLVPDAGVRHPVRRAGLVFRIARGAGASDDPGTRGGRLLLVRPDGSGPPALSVLGPDVVQRQGARRADDRDPRGDAGDADAHRNHRPGFVVVGVSADLGEGARLCPDRAPVLRRGHPSGGPAPGAADHLSDSPGVLGRRHPVGRLRALSQARRSDHLPGVQRLGPRGGRILPPEDMWPWLSGWSRVLPITYALRGLRRALLLDRPFADLLPDIRALLLFVAILLPLGVLAFRVAVRKARQEGSLVQY